MVSIAGQGGDVLSQSARLVRLSTAEPMNLLCSCSMIYEIFYLERTLSYRQWIVQIDGFDQTVATTHRRTEAPVIAITHSGSYRHLGRYKTIVLGCNL